MSSPYLAGCTAVIREYLKKQGIALSGSELAAHVRRLLMNTAVPYQADGLYVTPRRQGAGLVSLDRAAAAKVLMSGNSGDAKINLFDKLGDTFSFPLTLTNDSSEDVTYPKAEICLTTDGTYFSDTEGRTLLRGQQALRCTADFTGPVTVTAGQSKTVTVTVALDPAQSRALSQVFRYGFFTEGYLLLSGAENSADISVPMLGFHGDWAQIPAVPAGSETVLIEIGANYNSKPVSIVRQVLIYQQILSRISDDVLLDESAAKLIPLTYASAKEKKQLAFITDECWLSPDGDSIAERISTAAYDSSSARGFTKSSAKLLDSEGNVIYENPDSIWIDAEFPFSGLPDGEYTYEIKRILDYPDSAEHPQFFRCKVHIDTQKPEIRSRTYTENGRTYLMIEASDNGKLQGITVSGTGFGCRAGEAASDRSRRALEAETLAELLYDTGFGTENLVQSYGFDTASLPPALRCFADIAQPSESKDIQFADVLEPEPDDDGIWTVKYDIAELQHYSFTVLDEAYNFAEIRSQENAAEELAAKQGIWLDQTEGVYEIGNGKIKHTSYLDGSVTEYSFTAALIRHDGLVMILLLDASGNTLERYLADAVTGSLKTKISRRGDVNCDVRVDVSDAVLLARFLVEDTKAVISSAGIQNADCDLDHLITPDDMIIILRVIAKLIVF